MFHVKHFQVFSENIGIDTHLDECFREKKIAFCGILRFHWQSSRDFYFLLKKRGAPSVGLRAPLMPMGDLF